MNNYAIFISSDRTTLPCLNALLNSLDYYGISNIDVHLLHRNIPEKYINDIKNIFSFNLIDTKINIDDSKMHPFYMSNRIQIMQRSRYKYAFDISEKMKYSAISIMDADFIVVSKNLLNLFDLVSNKKKMIAANVKLKWKISNNYLCKNKPIFNKDIRLYKFHCNSPTFFNPSEWQDIYEYLQLFLNDSFEITSSEKSSLFYHGKNVKPVPDLFCWNMAIYKANRQDDVVLLSSDTLTQVHYSILEKTKMPMKHNEIWATLDGREIFTIHGKIYKKNWRDSHLAHLEDSVGIKRFNACARKILQEWLFFTLKHKVKISNYIDFNCEWE